MMEIKVTPEGRQIIWAVREPDASGTKHDGHRYYKTTGTIFYAECKEKGCNWNLEGPNGLGCGSLHHDKHGHHVEVFAVRAVHYGG